MHEFNFHQGGMVSFKGSDFSLYIDYNIICRDFNFTRCLASVQVEETEEDMELFLEYLITMIIPECSLSSKLAMIRIWGDIGWNNSNFRSRTRFISSILESFPCGRSYLESKMQEIDTKSAELLIEFLVSNTKELCNSENYTVDVEV